MDQTPILLSNRTKKMLEVGGGIFTVCGYISIPLSFVSFFAGSSPPVPYLGIELSQLSGATMVGLLLGGAIMSTAAAKQSMPRWGLYVTIAGIVISVISIILTIYWFGKVWGLI